MDLKLDPIQKEIQKAAKEFAEGEFDRELGLELDKKGEFPEAIWKMAAELGFIGLGIPEKYGGQGLGLFEDVLTAEAFCRIDSTIGSALMLAGFASECLVRSAGEDLKETYLPKVAEGKILSGAAFYEAGQGYLLSHVNTEAEEGGGEWIINGDKCQVINGGRAGFYCLLCRTNSNGNQPGGTSMLLVEGDREGVSAVNEGETLGFRMTPSSGLHFENVRVPLSNMIGKEGEGIKEAELFFEESRIRIGGLALGMAQGAFDLAVAYVKEREQFGRKIAEFQVTKHKLADMVIRIEQARFMTYHAAWKIDQRIMDPRLASMAKLASSRTAVEVSGEAIQLMGGYGYMRENYVERIYRDAKVTEMLQENAPLLKDKIAGHVIGRIK